MIDSHRSVLLCPCGLHFAGSMRESQAMYRAHRCALHEPEGDSPWPAVLVTLLFCLLASFLFTRGWGLVG